MCLNFLLLRSTEIAQEFGIFPHGEMNPYIFHLANGMAK